MTFVSLASVHLPTFFGFACVTRSRCRLHRRLTHSLRFLTKLVVAAVDVVVFECLEHDSHDRFLRRIQQKHHVILCVFFFIFQTSSVCVYQFTVKTKPFSASDHTTHQQNIAFIHLNDPKLFHFEIILLCSSNFMSEEGFACKLVY